MKKFFLNFNINKALRRFWPALFFALLGSILAIYAVDHHESNSTHLLKGILCSWMGMLAFINFRISVESFNIRSSYRIVFAAIILLFLFLLFYFLPDYEDLYYRGLVYSFIGGMLILHLLVATIPFFKNNNLESFWDYNRRILLLFIESFFNSMALYIGLTLAILALKFLFNVDLDDKIFLYTFIFIIGVFNTSYFLSRFPDHFYNAEIQAPSKGYAVFSQFIIIPLNIIYVVILYAYGIKIIVQQSLPKGWVSNLVLWFSVLGILAYLLNYFNPRFSNNPLTKLFKRWYFYLLPAPLLLLFIAIFTRINDYGLTEHRIIVASLGVWLTIISLYFIISKKDDIRIIPMSLIVCIAAVCIGPWSLGKASNRNQKNRLIELMINQGLIEGDRLVPVDSNKEYEKLRQTRDIINYLDESDQLLFFNNYEPYKSEQEKLLSRKDHIKADRSIRMNRNRTRLIEQLNIKLSDRIPGSHSDETLSYNADWSGISFDISAFDKLISFNVNQGDPIIEETGVGSTQDRKAIKILIEGREIRLPIEEVFKNQIENYDGHYNIEADSFSYMFEEEGVRGALFFRSALLNNTNQLELGYCQGMLFYSIMANNE